MLIVEQKSPRQGTRSRDAGSSNNKQRIDCLRLAAKLKAVLGKGSKDDYFTKISSKTPDRTVKAASSVTIPESAKEIVRRRRSMTRTFPSDKVKTEGPKETQHQRSFTIHEFASP